MITAVERRAARPAARCCGPRRARGRDTAGQRAPPGARRPPRPCPAVAPAGHGPGPAARALAVRAHVPARGAVRGPVVRAAGVGRTWWTRCSRHGTTTAVYFATVDVAATTALARTAADAGSGRSSAGWRWTIPTARPSGTATARRRRASRPARGRSTRSRPSTPAAGLVRPIITPRFTPACTDELLRGLGELAARRGVLVQTHCSESDWAHGYALERFGATDSRGAGRLRAAAARARSSPTRTT